MVLSLHNEVKFRKDCHVLVVRMRKKDNPPTKTTVCVLPRERKKDKSTSRCKEKDQVRRPFYLKRQYHAILCLRFLHEQVPPSPLIYLYHYALPTLKMIPRCWPQHGIVCCTGNVNPSCEPKCRIWHCHFPVCIFR